VPRRGEIDPAAFLSVAQLTEDLRSTAQRLERVTSTAEQVPFGLDRVEIGDMPIEADGVRIISAPVGRYSLTFSSSR